MSDKKLRRRLEGLFAGLPSVAADGAPGAAEPPPAEPASAPPAPSAPAGAPTRLAGWTWEIDLSGAFTFCSPEVMAILGYTPEEMAQHSLLDLLPSEAAETRHRLAEKLSQGQLLTDQRLPLRRKDGRPVMLNLHGLPVRDDDNRLAGYHGVMHILEPEPAAPAPLPPASPPLAAPPAEPEGGRRMTADEWRAYLEKGGRRGLGFIDGPAGLVPLDQLSLPAARTALEQGELVYYDRDSVGHQNGHLGRAARELAVPIHLQGQTLGVLGFFDEQDDRIWSEDELALVQAVADQLALAMENARLFEATRDQLSRRTLLYEVTRAAASAANLSEALQNAAQALGRVLPDSSVAILLLDPEGRRLRIRASVGFPPELAEQLAVPVGQGVTGRVAQTNQPALIRDVRAEPDYLAGVAETLSEVAVPLALGERVIGVLNAESPRPGAYDESDLQLLSTLAGTLSAIIVNNTLLEQITRERERLALLYDALQTLTQGLDLDGLLNAILSFAPRVGARHGYVLMLGETESQWRFRSTVPGLDRFTPLEARQFASAIRQSGLERWVLENGRTAFVPDTRLDPRWYTAPAHEAEEPARCVISSPLRTQRGKITGVLAFTHPAPNSLSDDQIPLIESIATQVAVALENAQLSQQRRLQQRNAEVLAQSTQAMTRSALNEADLMQALAEELYEAYLPDRVIVAHWSHETDELIPLAVRIGEMADAYAAEEARTPAPLTARPDLQAVLHSQQGAIRVVEARRDGRLTESMALPMTYGGEVEGVVEVVHTSRPGREGLGPDDLELLQNILTAFASALQTARLYTIQRETAERLAEVDRLKSQFLANMSHELRTPLNSIIGFSRVILKGIDGPLTDLQTQDLSSIYNAGQHLLGLINDILDLSKIEAGKMELVFDEVDLHDIVKGVLSTAVGLVKDKPIQLHEEVAPDLPAVRADSMRVRQVLINLLSNAAKFTDEGHITVRARPVEAVSPISGQPEAFVEINVVDTGPGIAPEDMSKLFEPFSQVDASATRKSGGTGLGLNICRHLVDLHGGRIWVESQVGQGSVFSLILPVNEPEPPAGPAVASDQAGGAKVVLAVDDDQGILRLYQRYLQSHGYQFVGLTRSPEVQARAEELQPAVILLDVLMPVMDGWQVLEALKASEATRDIPVILCTIVTDPERARDMGAADYLNKPILEADLLRALGRLESAVPLRIAVPGRG